MPLSEYNIPLSSNNFVRIVHAAERGPMTNRFIKAMNPLEFMVVKAENVEQQRAFFFSGTFKEPKLFSEVRRGKSDSVDLQKSIH